MHTSPSPPSGTLAATGLPVELRDGVPRRLGGGRGSAVVALRGRLWITIAGFPGDLVLRAGERWTLPGDGLALVEAIGGDALACVVAGEPATGARAAVARLRALAARAWRRLAARMAAPFAARAAPCPHLRPNR